MPGSSTSSTNSAWPVSSRGSSLRLIGAPKLRVAHGARSAQPFGRQRDRRRRCAGSRCSGTGCRRAPRGSPPRPADGVSSRKAVMVIRMPGVQKPHCRPWRRGSPPAADADGRRPRASPSTVVIAWPSACTANIRQERTGAPSTDHRAGAAHAVLAADMRAGEQQVVAQEIAQQQARLDLAPIGRAVHRDGDLVPISAHAAPVRSRVASARAVSTPAMWR